MNQEYYFKTHKHTYIMIITVRGSEGEGKTTFIEEVTKSKKTVLIERYDLKSAWAFRNVEKDTEFIHIPNVPRNELTDVINYFRIPNLTINKPYKENFIMRTPNIIIEVL